MDGSNRRVAQCRSAHARQAEDHRADDRRSIPSLSRRSFRPYQYPPLGHRPHLGRCRADDMVDDLLPSEGAPGNPRQGPLALSASRQDALIRAMPWVFVLIWSTGFIVARFGMPHSPPFTFLAIRYALSVICFGVWIALARAAWPRDSRQVIHLAVTGVLMHAGYLGGVWSAIKLGLGAGTIALLVGLQPILTAIWVTVFVARVRAGSGPQSGHERQITARQWAGLALGLAGLALVVWRKLGTGEVTL